MGKRLHSMMKELHRIDDNQQDFHIGVAGCQERWGKYHTGTRGAAIFCLKSRYTNVVLCLDNYHFIG